MNKNISRRQVKLSVVGGKNEEKRVRKYLTKEYISGCGDWKKMIHMYHTLKICGWVTH